MGVGERPVPTALVAPVATDALLSSPPSSGVSDPELPVELCESRVNRLVKADSPLASMLEELESKPVEVSELEKDESLLVTDAAAELFWRSVFR